MKSGLSHRRLEYLQLANFVLVLISLSLGQLLRIDLKIGAVYPHDFLIGIFFGLSLLNRTITFKQAVNKLRQSQRKWLQLKLEIVFCLWLSLNLIYQALAHQNYLNLLYDVRVVYYSLFILLTHHQLQQWRRQKTLATRPWFLFIIFFILGLGLLQYSFFHDLRSLYQLGWDDHYGRLVSGLLDPNFAGFLLGLGLVYWQAWRQRLNQGWWLINLILIVALTLTFSRASYLATSLGLIATMFITKVVKLRWSVGLSLVLLFAGILFIPKPLGEGGNLLRTASIKARIVNDLRVILDQKSQLRIYNSKFKIQNNPTQNPTTETRKPLTNSKLVSHARQPNNLAVLVWQQTGLIGLGLFIALLIKWSRYLWQQSHLANILLLMLLIHAQFNNTAFEPFVFLIFWGAVSEVLRLKLDV